MMLIEISKDALGQTEVEVLHGLADEGDMKVTFHTNHVIAINIIDGEVPIRMLVDLTKEPCEICGALLMDESGDILHRDEDCFK